jgi:hypothetical protein
MWNKSKMLRSIEITLTLLFCIAFLALPAEVEGGAKVVTIEGMSYNVNSSMEDNLKSLLGKKVYVTLDSGKTLAGFVKEVGNHLIHVEKIEGKDFFDALIRIESVIALEAKFRDFKR